jgi:hypothetical protein
MKRIDTRILEQVLQDGLFGSNPKLAKEYGTTEVTIGFQRSGKGKELVDFLSYDPKKEIFRCYEIKVSMADFHSKAKKSWYGNYNYLVLSEELYQEQPLKAWKKEIPDHVGILVINPYSSYKQTVKRASFCDITSETKQMLKDSLLRTLFYQNIRNAKR